MAAPRYKRKEQDPVLLTPNPSKAKDLFVPRWG